MMWNLKCLSAVTDFFFIVETPASHYAYVVIRVRLDSSLCSFHCDMCTVNCVKLHTVQSSTHLLYVYVLFLNFFLRVVCRYQSDASRVRNEIRK